MKILIISLAFATMLGLNAYSIVRGWQSLATHGLARWIYLCIMLVLFLSMFGAMIFSHLLPHMWAKILSLAGFTYMLLFLYLAISFFLIDIIRVANSFFPFLPVPVATFRFWSFIASLVAIGCLMIIGNVKYNHPAVNQYSLKSDRSQHGKSINIVMASDLHLGVTTDKKQLAKYVKLINQQHPDIILLVGDVTDRSILPVIQQQMKEELSQLKAPLGVFAVNGNHEHYAETPDATEKYLTSSGIKVLKDSSVLVDNAFYLIGRDDRSNQKRKSLAQLTRGLEQDKPRILMDHQPHALFEARQYDVDLQLSGHTHQGQFFPGNLLVNMMYELPYGYLKKGHTHYLVSSGLSLWGPPFRIGTQSELLRIDFSY